MTQSNILPIPEVIENVRSVIQPLLNRLARSAKRRFTVRIAVVAGDTVAEYFELQAQRNNQPTAKLNGKLRFRKSDDGSSTLYWFEAFLDDGPLDMSGFIGFTQRGVADPWAKAQVWEGLYGPTPSWSGWLD